jgi:hypothetical protein
MMIPGRRLHRLAASICSTNTLERSVEPAIADLQKEHAGARDVAGRVSVLLAGYFAIFKVIAICAGTISVETHEERRALLRMVAWSGAMFLVTAALLTGVPISRYDAVDANEARAVAVQALPLAIPIGLALGLAFGIPSRLTMTLKKATVLGALAASAVSLVTLAWAVPAANHALGIHQRFALAVASLTLASVLIAAPVTHRVVRTVLGFGVCFAYWVLMFAGDLGHGRGYLTASLAAWLPNLVLFASAIVFAASRSSWLRGSSLRGRVSSAR